MNWFTWILLPSFFPQYFIIKIYKHITLKKPFIVHTHIPTIYIQLWTLKHACFISVHLFVPLPILFLFALFQSKLQASVYFLLTPSLLPKFCSFLYLLCFCSSPFLCKERRQELQGQELWPRKLKKVPLDSSNTRSYRAVNGRRRCCPSRDVLPLLSLLLNLLLRLFSRFPWAL